MYTIKSNKKFRERMNKKGRDLIFSLDKSRAKLLLKLKSCTDKEKRQRQLATIMTEVKKEESHNKEQ